MYAQSTLAASTIMPGVLMQPVRNTESTQWVEGHCLNWKTHDKNGVCVVCEDRSDEGIYKCSGESIVFSVSESHEPFANMNLQAATS